MSIKNGKMDDYPWGTILLIFLVIVSIIIIYDLYVYLSTFFIPINQSNTPISQSESTDNPIVINLNQSESTDNPIVINLNLNPEEVPNRIYGQEEFTRFISLFLLNPTYYAVAVSVCIFDRILFSRYWLATNTNI